jgi:hypothetical protein
MTTNPPAATMQAVKELTISSGAGEANRLMAAGWTLLAIATGQDEQGFPLMYYSLGWSKTEPPPRV